MSVFVNQKTIKIDVAKLLNNILNQIIWYNFMCTILVILSKFVIVLLKGNYYDINFNTRF